jgi:hypothetical protein
VVSAKHPLEILHGDVYDLKWMCAITDQVTETIDLPDPLFIEIVEYAQQRIEI